MQAERIRHVLGTTVEASINGAAIRIEIEKCDKCGGKVRVIASIEEPELIEKILRHLGLDRTAGLHNRSPPTCADGLFDQTTILI
jgi:hypothetical protein